MGFRNRAIGCLTAMIIMVGSAFPTLCAAQSSMTDFQRGEWRDALAAMRNPTHTRTKLARVYAALVVYSNKRFQLIPQQTNRMGISKRGGRILIDVSVLGKIEPLVAFWAAHEWAHQDLGHSPNRLASLRKTYRAMMLRRRYPTLLEDQADDYAGRFLAKMKYDVRPVIRHLCDFPHDPSDKGHSSGPQRARIVARSYARISGRPVFVPCAAIFRANLSVTERWRQTARACTSCRAQLRRLSPRNTSPGLSKWCRSVCVSLAGRRFGTRAMSAVPVRF